MNWKSLAVSVVLAFAWTGAALYSAQPDPPATAPVPVVHTYNILFFDGESTSLQGTEIRTAGFCVEVMEGSSTHTIVCQVRHVTERITEDKGDEPAPAPSRTEPRVG